MKTTAKLSDEYPLDTIQTTNCLFTKSGHHGAHAGFYLIARRCVGTSVMMMYQPEELSIFECPFQMRARARNLTVLLKDSD